jgi:type III secretion protein U
MPANDTTEEKSLPATAKKLREGRKKGQVEKSHDLVAAIAVAAAVLYVYFIVPRVDVYARELIDVGVRIYREPFVELWPHALELALRVLVITILPMVVIVFVVVAIASLAAMRGPVFSIDPIKPNMDHVNPVKGFQRIFSAKSVVEFAKAVFKVTVLAVAIVAVFRAGMQTLFESPRCGAVCVYDAFFSMLKPILIVTLVAFIVIGIIDVALQRWLFLREMRMTKTEFKREMKDVEGDPLIKRERQRRLREMGNRLVKVGLRNASLLLGRSDGFAVGLRFVRGETPVPVIVCRAGPGDAQVLITEAVLLGIPVVEEAQLARSLGTTCKVGDPVPDAAFQPVADILVATRLA